MREFEAQAAALAADIGDLVIEDDDDERLTLTASGRFQGEVLSTRGGAAGAAAPGTGPAWETLATADDVVDFYDPVDLFDDVADAIDEAFPTVDSQAADAPDAVPARPAAAAAPAPSADPWLARVGKTEDEPGPARDASTPPETATMTMLRDLHAAGVYTDAEFEAKMAELTRG